MTIVMEMSTDLDITLTPVANAWNPVLARYNWASIIGMNLGIAGGSTIVVIAHGNGEEIGNAQPGTVDILPTTFLALIASNCLAAPAAIYISTCGPGIAEFAAGVRLLAEQNGIWAHTRIFGHSDPVSGQVPPPNDIRWFEIFAG